MSWLENIQNKPPQQKRKIIYLILTLITFLLFFLWFITGNSNQNQQEGSSYIQDLKNNLDYFSKNFNPSKSK